MTQILGNRIADLHSAHGLCHRTTGSKGSSAAIAHETRKLLILCS